MTTAIFRWLHFSDLHVGLSAGRRLWPSYKTKFLDDLSAQYEHSGPWDAVIFTGDLTQAGKRSEYDELDTILGEIWSRFDELGTAPTLITIPGNHDLARPDELDSHAIAFRNYWDTPALQEKLLEGKAAGYLDFLAKCFAEYCEWQARLIRDGRHAAPTARGLLPGDAAYGVEAGGQTIGVVGLNSSWLQLSDGNHSGKLAVDVRQLLAVTGNDPDQWCSGNAANILLTHHPVSWLHEQSQQYWPSDIDTNQRFDLHLFGHMHDHDLTSVSRGGGPTRRAAQASSLFGLEAYEGGKVARVQGYSLNHFIDGPDYRTLRVWPRILSLQKDQDRKITSDTSMSLTNDQYYDVPYTPRTPPPPQANGPEHSAEAQPAIRLTLASEPRAIASELEKIRHYIADEPAHWNVRTLELRGAEKALAEHRILWSVSDWGMGEDGFLGAIQLRAGEAGVPTYRFDFGDYQSREQFLADTQERFGVAFEVLCANIATVGPAYILFNDIPVERDAVPGEVPIEVDIEGIAALLAEFARTAKVVLRATRRPRRSPRFPVVELKALDEPDVTVYLREHPQGGERLATSDTVGALYRHTDGVPSRLDSALRKLGVTSLKAVVKANTDLGDRAATTSVPPALINAVAHVEDAQKAGSGYPFELLKALASLPRGDQIERIERLNGPKALQPDDALMLIDRGLVDSVLVSGLQARDDSTGAKTLMVPRPVREYVRKRLTDTQAQSLDRKMIELYFGKNWKSAKITSSRAGRNAASSLCDMYVVTNSCALIIRHLRLAVERNNLVEIEAGIRLASAFAVCLDKGNHHRAAADLCGDVLELLPAEGYARERTILEFERAGNLRMTKDTAGARDLILGLDMAHLSKSQRQTAKLDLSLAYKSLGDAVNTAKAARECIAIDARSGPALQAKSILVEQDEDKQRRIEELVKLRGRSSRKEAYLNANNIAITLAREARRDGDVPEALRLLREVIDSARQHKDFYNGARAIADIAGCLPAGECFDPGDKILLMDAYHFAHNERQSALFDQCHRGLWKAFEAEDDIENLLRLYRSSSFIWRLHGRDDVERKYLERLRSLQNGMALPSSDREYFYIRVILVFGEG